MENQPKTINFYKTVNTTVIIADSIALKELEIKVRNRERKSGMRFKWFDPLAYSIVRNTT